MVQQVLGGDLQLLPALGQNLLAPGQGLVHDPLDFLVNLPGHLLRVSPGLGHGAADEDLAALAAVGDGTQPLAHAVLGDHGPGDLRGLLNVAGRPGGDIPQHQPLRRPAAQADGDPLLQLPLGQIDLVLVGQGDGHAARGPPGDDGNLVDRVLGGQLMDHHGVARLVVGGEPPGLLCHHPAALLRPGDDLQHGLAQVVHSDKPLVLAGGQQGRLVEQVLQVGPGKAGGGLGDVP